MSARLKSIIYIVSAVIPLCAPAAPPASKTPVLPENWSVVDSMLVSKQQPRPDTMSAWPISATIGLIGLDDPVLDSLLARCKEANPDVLTAMRRVEVARHGLKSAQSAYYPQIDLSAGWSRTRTAGSPAVTASAWRGQLSMNWEIDVFGRITASARRERSRIAASRAAMQATELTVAATMASAYISLRQYQAQLKVALSHARSEAEIVKITETRYNTGLASKLDVAQARTVYGSTVASIPLLRYSIHAGINAIAVLLGETPEAVSTELRRPRPLPDYLRIVDTGVPARLLRRRPDLIEAERNIDVAAASLGVERKAYLPSLSLTGSVGTAATKTGNLFTSDSFGYTIAPTLSWTVFDGMARRAAVASANEELMIAVDSYNLAVATAYEEADNALANYHYTLQYVDAVSETLADSEEAGRLSLDRYKQGLTDFTAVADALTTILQNRNTQIEAQARALNALVDIYRALGGDIDR